MLYFNIKPIQSYKVNLKLALEDKEKACPESSNGQALIYTVKRIYEVDVAYWVASSFVPDNTGQAR
ncbi:hypothetical protein D0463_05045 [Bacillus sp. V59.32b]|nr:hypothetical protein D0463_05045 [Bacillus sp. V59.32b]